MKKEQLVRHEFEPVYDKNSEILILGSFPSVKSREQGFYYGHPQNRFWKVLAAIVQEKIPDSIEEKKEMLLRNHIAVYDVIWQCKITGSSDSSIKNVIPANLSEIIGNSQDYSRTLENKENLCKWKTGGKTFFEVSGKEGWNKSNWTSLDESGKRSLFFGAAC